MTGYLVTLMEEVGPTHYTDRVPAEARENHHVSAVYMRGDFFPKEVTPQAIARMQHTVPLREGGHAMYKFDLGQIGTVTPSSQPPSGLVLIVAAPPAGAARLEMVPSK